MATFDDALQFTLEWEGGAVNNPNDPGGATFEGITQSLYDECCRRFGWTPGPVAQATGEQIRQIYLTQFWNAARCDVMPADWAIAVFDFAVNSGVEAAIIGAQVTLTVAGMYSGAIDGDIGPVTLKAMGSASATWLMDHRAGYQQGLWTENPKLVTFMKGWLKRDLALRAKIVAGRNQS